MSTGVFRLLLVSTLRKFSIFFPISFVTFCMHTFYQHNTDFVLAKFVLNCGKKVSSIEILLRAKCYFLTMGFSYSFYCCSSCTLGFFSVLGNI